MITKTTEYIKYMMPLYGATWLHTLINNKKWTTAIQRKWKKRQISYACFHRWYEYLTSRYGHRNWQLCFQTYKRQSLSVVCFRRNLLLWYSVPVPFRSVVCFGTRIYKLFFVRVGIELTVVELTANKLKRKKAVSVPTYWYSY